MKSLGKARKIWMKKSKNSKWLKKKKINMKKKIKSKNELDL
jgi:hypothetical protein